MIRTSIWLALILLIAPLSAFGQSSEEGKKLYVSYCSTCHGERGKGDGPAGRALPVKAADHTNAAVMNQFTDKYLIDIITKGGGAVGKSPIMPAWGNQFDEKQIRDIVAFVRTLAGPSKTKAK
jgi:mono/diheme cytochrome c family protein